MAKHIACILSILAFATLWWACGSSKGGNPEEESEPRMPDTLRVATLYSPTSYFLYRDEEMGYDYSLVSTLAREKNITLDLKIATSLRQAMEMLDSGDIDMIAYEVPITSDYRDRVIPCGPVSLTSQVLVQPAKKKSEMIKDVTQLVGKDVYVMAESKYQQRIQNLNDELGGGINIHTVNRDTIIAEDLIEMVSEGQIPLTIVDSDVAKINKTYYPSLDITMELSFPQKSSWAVAKNHQWLADSIDEWLAQETPKKENAMLLKRYFERSKGMPESPLKIDFSKGFISQYDQVFRDVARGTKWDWRMIAAQAYVESRFTNDPVSWAGAKGIMQIMPATARSYGVDPATLIDPAISVELAIRIMDNLDKTFQKRIPDDNERVKFVLAAYNGGLAHILDAIALAESIGRNPQVWDGNVAEALLLKANPQYYNRPEVKYGYFHGRQTYSYVNKVNSFYQKAKQSIPQ